MYIYILYAWFIVCDTAIVHTLNLLPRSVNVKSHAIQQSLLPASRSLLCISNHNDTHSLTHSSHTHTKWQMRNYTATGFAKIRAPDAVFRLVKEFWDHNKDSLINEWSHSTPYHNIWEAPTSVIRIDNSSLIGGGTELYNRIADAARDAMEVRTGGSYVCFVRS